MPPTSFTDLAVFAASVFLEGPTLGNLSISFLCASLPSQMSSLKLSNMHFCCLIELGFMPCCDNAETWFIIYFVAASLVVSPKIN